MLFLRNQLKLHFSSERRNEEYNVKVYIEEWDEPVFVNQYGSGEVIQICGGEDIFAEKSKSSLAKEDL